MQLIAVGLVFGASIVAFHVSSQIKTAHLIKAVTNGDLTEMQELLDRGVCLDCRSFDGLTPLTEAASQGKREAVNLLIKEGANVNYKDSAALTPLFWASIHGHTDIVEILISQGAQLETPEAVQRTFLQKTQSFRDGKLDELLRQVSK